MEQLINLVEVESFVKPVATPATVFTLYKELVEVFNKEWSKLERKEKLVISSNLNLNLEYTARLLKDNEKSFSISQLFKFCYFFKQDLVLVKGKEKIVFSIVDLKSVENEIIRLNKIMFEVIKYVPVSHLANLSKIQHLSLYNLKDIYITRRNFVRYMRLLVNFDITFHIVPTCSKKEKEFKNVA